MRTAIGFDQKRGDQVEVVNLRFAEMPANPINEPTGWLAALQFTKDDIMRAIEMAVMGLLGLVVLLMVVRPLVRRMLTPEEQAPLALPAQGLRLVARKQTRQTPAQPRDADSRSRARPPR